MCQRWHQENLLSGPLFWKHVLQFTKDGAYWLCGREFSAVFCHPLLHIVNARLKMTFHAEVGIYLNEDSKIIYIQQGFQTWTDQIWRKSGGLAQSPSQKASAPPKNFTEGQDSVTYCEIYRCCVSVQRKEMMCLYCLSLGFCLYIYSISW